MGGTAFRQRLRALVLVFCVSLVNAQLQRSYANCQIIDITNDIKLHWTVNGQTLQVGIEAHLGGYVAVGFSEDGLMTGGTPGFADIWFIDTTTNSVRDGYLEYVSHFGSEANLNCSGFSQPKWAETESLTESIISTANGRLYGEFNRLLNTGDNYDYVISTTAIMTMIWAGHPTRPITSDRVPLHRAGAGIYEGSVSVNFGRATTCGGSPSPVPPPTPTPPPPPTPIPAPTPPPPTSQPPATSTPTSQAAPPTSSAIPTPTPSQPTSQPPTNPTTTITPPPQPAPPGSVVTRDYESPSGDFRLDWTIDTASNRATFTMTAMTTAFGLCRIPSMVGADEYVGWVNPDTSIVFLDSYSNNRLQPVLKSNSQVSSISGSESDGRTTITFSRPITSNEAVTLALTEPGLFLLYAYGRIDGIGTGQDAFYPKHTITGISTLDVVPHTTSSVAPVPSATKIEGATWKSQDGKFQVTFTLDVTDITFAMSAKASGYVAIALAKGAAMAPSDVYVGWITQSGAGVLLDSWASSYEIPRTDETQGGKNDATLVGAHSKDGWIHITFKRALNTGDNRDISVGDATHLLYAYADGTASEFFYPKHDHYGSVRANLLDADPFSTTSPLRPGIITLVIIMIWSLVYWIRKWRKGCCRRGYSSSDWDNEYLSTNASLPPPAPTSAPQPVGYDRGAILAAGPTSAPADPYNRAARRSIYGAQAINTYNSSGSTYQPPAPSYPPQSPFNQGYAPQNSYASSSPPTGPPPPTGAPPTWGAPPPPSGSHTRDQYRGSVSYPRSPVAAAPPPAPSSPPPPAGSPPLASASSSNSIYTYDWYGTSGNDNTATSSPQVELDIGIGSSYAYGQNRSCGDLIYGIFNERIPGYHFAAGDVILAVVWILLNAASLFILQDIPLVLSFAGAGNALGSLLAPNSVLSVLLAARNSLLSLLIGVPFDRTIMWHRWLGRFCFILLILHFALQIVKYAVAGMDALNVTLTLVAWEGTPTIPLFGLLAAVCALGMFITSLEYFRRKKFEVFSYAHYLFIGYFILAAFHHSNMVVWSIIAGAIYLLDILLRALWGMFPQRTTLLNLKPGYLLQVRFPKWLPALHNYRVGQYIFVNFPGISPNEWHPFSISSSPEEKDIEIHVRALGDWTSKLNIKAQYQPYMYVMVDGPYGNLRLDYRRYPHLLFVAGGIGFSPVLGILKTIYLSPTPQRTRNTSVTVVWSLPEETHAHWFDSELAAISAAAQRPGHPTFNLRIHVTRARPGTVPAPLLEGRPDMKTHYNNIASSLKGEACFVFVCGPRKMVNENWDLCAQHTRQGVRFNFHHETFDF